VLLLLQTWTVDKELKGWSAAQKKFFDAGQVRGQTLL
jgi:ABC-type sulfate transport system substrate-binding protein